MEEALKRVDAMWGILLATEEAAKEMTGSILTIKSVKMQKEDQSKATLGWPLTSPMIIWGFLYTTGMSLL